MLFLAPPSHLSATLPTLTQHAVTHAAVRRDADEYALMPHYAEIVQRSCARTTGPSWRRRRRRWRTGARRARARAQVAGHLAVQRARGLLGDAGGADLDHPFHGVGLVEADEDLVLASAFLESKTSKFSESRTNLKNWQI